MTIAPAEVRVYKDYGKQSAVIALKRGGEGMLTVTEADRLWNTACKNEEWELAWFLVGYMEGLG